MKRRDSLFQAKKFRVDELKRRVSTLEEMRADLARKLSDLEESVAREKQRTADSELGRLAFPSFLQSIETRRQNISATMRELEREHGLVEEGLAAAELDLKAFEMAERERERRIGETAERAARARVENMALVRHLRKHATRRM
jgi:flagellar FliJ protein